jgi:hypothetical protein
MRGWVPRAQVFECLPDTCAVSALHAGSPEGSLSRAWTLGTASRLLGSIAVVIVLYLGFTFVAHDLWGGAIYPWNGRFDFGSGVNNLALAIPIMLIGAVALVAIWSASLRLTGQGLEITNLGRCRRIAQADLRSLDVGYWGVRIGYQALGADRSMVALAGMSLINARLFPGASRTRKIADVLARELRARGVLVETRYRPRHERDT